MLAVADHGVFRVFHGLLEIPLQQALQRLAVSRFVANPSDFVPVAGIARAFRTAFGTSSSGRACVAVFVRFTALFAFPAALFFWYWVIHVRCNIGIYPFALRTYDVGI